MTDILMPKLGLTMTEGQLTEWRVGPGDAYSAGDVLFVVETEKSANDVEADSDGVIGEILVSAGETVPVGAPVARLQGAAAPAAPEHHGAAPPPAAGAAEPEPASRQTNGARVAATPLARRIARTEGVDLHTLKGSGPCGRIKAADVKRAGEQSDAQTSLPGADAED